LKSYPWRVILDTQNNFIGSGAQLTCIHRLCLGRQGVKSAGDLGPRPVRDAVVAAAQAAREERYALVVVGCKDMHCGRRRSQFWAHPSTLALSVKEAFIR
jgi:hypothetical protein